MIKKLISIFLTAVILMSSLGYSFIVFAANSVSVDSFVESVEELNEEESEAEKTFEESVGSRVIVKALQKPSIFGNAEYFKGTFGKHIFQYANEEEAIEAVEYYSSLSSVIYAVRDKVVNSFAVPYGEAMLGTQRAKEYIANNEIPTSSVKVAVIDTGIDFTHELFKENPRIIDSGLNVTGAGWENTSRDDEGHGSLCTELIMKNTTDDVSIIGYKALNGNGSGTNLWIATAIEKAIEDDVDVINLSLGGISEAIGLEGTSIVLDDAVQLAISKGIIVVAASGNDGLNAEHFSPANVDGVITVGAIDKAGNRAYFSNYGDVVDFVAPGVDIEHEYVRKYVGSDGLKHTDYPDPVDGTSFSCPYVVSEVATLLTVNHNLSRNAVVSKLKSASVPYEHLTYHDGFHPIEEDRITRGYSTYFANEWYEEVNPVSLCYGNGMPQVDLAIAFENSYEREKTPTFSLDSGHFIDVEYDLFLTSSPDAEIYYTTDESYPTKENGIKFEGQIHLDELQSVRAVAFSNNKAPSYFDAKEYFFEYHAAESDFQADKYEKGRFNKYYGTRKNIIVPETINGITVTRISILETPNTQLTSIKLPASVTMFGASNGTQSNIVSIDGEGLINVGFTNLRNDDYKSLVKVNLPNAQNVTLNYSNIRELYLPKAVNVRCNYCYCLRKVNMPNFVSSDKTSFQECYSLSEVNMPKCEWICEYMFFSCCKLSKVTFENVRSISTQGLALCFLLKTLNLPNLHRIYNGALNSCGVQFLYAPKLETMENIGFSYTTYDETETYHSKLIVSSSLKEIGEDAEGEISTTPGVVEHYRYVVDIYGTPNTYAEEYANKFNLKFVPLPLMESEPESMRASDSLSVDVLGFNLEYQWYGTNIADNRLGEAIEGANGETFNPDDFGSDYDFYYCVIKSSDGDYHKTLVTGDRIRLDVNGDGVIDIADISLLLSMYGEAPAEPFQDFNGDGVIDVSEISLLLKSTVYGTKE